MVRADVTTVGWEGANASAVLACMQNRAMKRRKMERIMTLVGLLQTSMVGFDELLVLVVVRSVELAL